MHSHLHQTFLFLSFCSLIFFNSAHAKCVPRNATTPSPNPDTPPELHPVSSPKSPSPPAPTPSPSPSKEPPIQSAQSSPTPRQPFFRRPSIFPSATQNTGNASPGIKKICDSTDYPDLCLSTISPQVKGLGDVHLVLNIAIKAGLDFAKTALSAAEKMATKPGTPPNLASMFKDCQDSYDDALYNFQNAMDAGSGDLGTTNTMLSAVITDIGDCEDAFQGQTCPLASYSEKVTKMASNCLAIASLIH